MAYPTKRAFRGCPISRATCPYETTFPRGTRRTVSYTLSLNSPMFRAPNHVLRQRHLFTHNYRHCLHLASAHFLRLSRAKASCVIPSHARRSPEQGKPGANPARSRHCDATAKLPSSQNTCQEAYMRKRRLSANAPSVEALLRSKATPPDCCRRQTFAVCLLREREPNPARLRAKTHAGKGKEKKDSESNNCANAGNARAKSDRAAHGARPLHGADPPTQPGQKKRGGKRADEYVLGCAYRRRHHRCRERRAR